ncbi:hypothetical protein PGT21_034057 [Puccinia graminis f. sp. tritici]|uniref:Uncharacterized protein n=1 Tax=Puccinia graminis f. sp. tritici TaxID=56615 RepID=A0A5B0M9D3_PUCGR|nr:hypothetical protein PGTUg99_012667 [Puccinia graminis f. sp. tritici]KAA1084678.1 hypothetical protein PGT21_034057 [Puccinia graminis f. sp. tritici]
MKANPLVLFGTSLQVRPTDRPQLLATQPPPPHQSTLHNPPSQRSRRLHIIKKNTSMESPHYTSSGSALQAQYQPGTDQPPTFSYQLEPYHDPQYLPPNLRFGIQEDPQYAPLNDRVGFCQDRYRNHQYEPSQDPRYPPNNQQADDYSSYDCNNEHVPGSYLSHTSPNIHPNHPDHRHGSPRYADMELNLERDRVGYQDPPSHSRQHYRPQATLANIIRHNNPRSHATPHLSPAIPPNSVYSTGTAHTMGTTTSRMPDAPHDLVPSTLPPSGSSHLTVGNDGNDPDTFPGSSRLTVGNDGNNTGTLSGSSHLTVGNDGNNPGTLSGSSQLTVGNNTNNPGTLSGSSQLTVGNDGNNPGTLSGSSQLTVGNNGGTFDSTSLTDDSLPNDPPPFSYRWQLAKRSPPFSYQ